MTGYFFIAFNNFFFKLWLVVLASDTRSHGFVKVQVLLSSCHLKIDIFTEEVTIYDSFSFVLHDT